MKPSTILILTLGLAIVIADPISIEETSSNKKPCPKLSGNSGTDGTYVQDTKEKMENIEVEFNLVDNSPTENTIVIKELEAALNSAEDRPTNTEVVENAEAASELINDVLTNDNVVIEKTEPALDSEDDTNNIVIIEKTEVPFNSADDTPTKNTVVIEKIDVQPDLIDNTPDLADNTPNFGDEVVDIVIDNNAALPKDVNIATPLEEVDSASAFENIFKSQSTINEEFSVPNYLFRNGLQNRIASEIMAAAKGFAPLPSFSFRRKQNNRRRFAIRRRYNGYPYRRRFNSFYPYYSFYRPSSLTYY